MIQSEGTQRQTLKRIATQSLLVVLLLGMVGMLEACSTAPKEEDKGAFVADARAATSYFTNNVPGLREQIANSGGYVVYPAVGQYGILIGGGRFGRGLTCMPDGTQDGWGYLNTASLGLQAGVQGFKMLVVFEDESVMQKFKENKLTGSANAVAVAAEAGGSGTGSFTNGVVVYQGANTGLMAGVNVALDYLRYQQADPAD